MRIQAKRVLVTGGTSGIGFALGRELIRHGASIFICGRDHERLRKALANLPEATGITCDLGRTQEIQPLVHAAVTRLGGLDMVINNAGIQLSWDLDAQATDDASALERVEREIATNITGPIQLSFAALPHLRNGTDAAIVNVTSVLARAPKPAAPVYSATKAALRNFSRAIAPQLQAQGVRVVEVVPPLVDTQMTQARTGEKTISAELMAQQIVTGLARDRSEIVVGKARLAALLARWAPGMLENMMAKPADGTSLDERH